MKLSFRIVCLALIVLLLTLSGCDLLFGSHDPVTTVTSTTNLDGSITEKTSTVFDNGNEIIDEKTTFLDGTISEKHTDIEMDNHGNVTEESKETITYSSNSNMTSQVIDIKISNDDHKGACSETTTTTNFKDNSKKISSLKTEGETGYHEVSEEIINVDGSSIKEKTWSRDVENVGYTGKQTTEAKDSNGTLTSKTEIEFDTQVRENTFRNSTIATRTVTTYNNGEIATITVETLRDTPYNDRSYIREVKDKDGKITLKEIEYKFDNTLQGIIIFRSQGDTYEAKVVSGSLYGEIEHQAFVTTSEHFDTVMKIEDSKITIDNKEYTIKNDLTLSFGSMFN